MNSDTLREQIRRVPFRRFTLSLPDGRTVTIYDPKQSMLSPSGSTLLVARGECILPIQVVTAEVVKTPWIERLP